MGRGPADFQGLVAFRVRFFVVGISVLFLRFSEVLKCWRSCIQKQVLFGRRNKHAGGRLHTEAPYLYSNTRFFVKRITPEAACTQKQTTCILRRMCWRKQTPAAAEAPYLYSNKRSLGGGKRRRPFNKHVICSRIFVRNPLFVCRCPSGILYVSWISIRNPLLFVDFPQKSIICSRSSFRILISLMSVHLKSFMFRGFPSEIRYVSRISIRNPLFCSQSSIRNPLFVADSRQDVLFVDFPHETCIFR